MTQLSPEDRPHPYETDCSEVIADLWVYLDQECDTRREQVLQRHLDDCGSCLERYGIERQLKELLHRKCGGDLAPDQFRDRLRDKLRASITQVTASDGTVSVTETTVDVERTIEDH